MNLVKFLQKLVIKGWKFWNEGERMYYDAPREQSASSVLAQLKQHKAEILQLLRDRPDIFNIHPLSHGQRGLWFLWQLEPLSAAYNQVFTSRICDDVNVTNLRSAFEKLLERHPSLRSTFPKLGEEPIQQIHQEQKVDFQQIDASAWSETELYSSVTQESQRPFDLEHESVIRVRLFTCSQKEHILLLTIHHIATDGWSLDIILSELPKLYQAQQDGVLASLPTLKHSYSDYVNSQKKMLQSSQGEKLWSYWQEKLKGELPALNLPTDKPRPPIQTYNGASINFQLSDQLTQHLKQLANSSDATLYMTLLAAFEVLLYHYTGQEDILVGSPVAGRLQSQFRGIVGYCVNQVVLRGDLSNNPSFKEFIIQIRQTVLEALTHQDYPLALLVEKLQPHRDPSRSPIFQAGFALQQLQHSQDLQKLFVNEIEKEVDWGGLKLRAFAIPQYEGQFDLTLEMMEVSSSVFGTFKYNTDLFDGSTIERMAGHFQNLLSAIGSNPQLSVRELPLLSDAERHQLLVEWNDTAREYPSDKCIHQLFESQVEKTPLSVAVVFKNQQLTYYQLNQRANQLAHHLQSLGVGPEVLVGICVERSLEMVVGLLGILKAGGAYLPLDPNYPAERLSYMLADSAVEVLLTQKSLLESLPEHQARVVCLDSDWRTIEQNSLENLEVGVCGDNLAYVIYTSGSTGKPKGAMISHQAIANHMFWMLQTFSLTKLDKVLQKTPFSFDASIWEFYAPLLVGAQLVIAKPGGHQDSDYLIEVINQQKITVLQLVPSLLRMLLETRGLAICQSLKRVFCGGEPLSVELYCRFKQQSQATLHNLYGPTEACIDTHFYTCQEGIRQKTIPIGRPIVNTQTYILDHHLQPVPIGIAGELHIGGDGLARGYLNRPQLTQEKFIPNPFSNSQSERLYKTGDLARYLSDGNIEFLGRLDNQVKIRGFRIELGEIESILNTHPQIQQAVVTAREDIPGNKRLVVYVVTSDESLSSNKLREFLKPKLPEYMVPSAFVTLDTFPLTPNGKIDRKALPAPDGEITREHEYVAPRTPREEIIANIFASVLGVQAIGIHDNFFELGGHSLLATQLISRLREAFELEIPLRIVFESPTVAQLEPTLTQLRTTVQGLSLPPIQPREADREQLPLSWAQERLWFLNQLEGASATYNMPGAIRLSGNLDINALQRALSEIVSRHEVLRTSFPTVNGTPRQVIDPEATLNIKVVDLQQLEATEPETVLIQQAQQEAITPFNLEIAPLIRCSLWQLDAREYVLLLTMHHIVSDGWSMGVFIQEISSLYQAFTQGEPSPLPELPIQYADFAIWQRQWLSGEVLLSQLNYWQQQLEGAPELLQLPTDRPRPNIQTHRGATQTFSLNIDLTQKLQTLSRESGTTLFMILQAAFATLLYRYSGQSDIVIGSPIANRHYSEIESLIGFFVNTLVLRTRFEDNPRFEKLLARVRETTLKAYEHQDVPFEQVVEALQPQRSLSHSPLFQVMFVLQNAPMGEVELPGVTLSELNLQSTIAKFDLTLSMSETDQGLVGSWQYNTDLFDGSTIERMVAHFQNLLSAIVENPQRAVGELPLLSEAEQDQLLVEWNDTEREYPIDKCIHQLFEEQVERTPDAVAVVFEKEQLTYVQLNQRANQLAHHLQTLGVRPEVLVGICVERSLEMVVGLLGILKAGGAYVPLDPNYPPERLSYMLADSGVEVLLTQQELLESLPLHTSRVVCLDTYWGRIEQHSQENLEVRVCADNLAYVIYTSGSTGKPKGVSIIHQGVVRLVKEANYASLTCQEVFLQLAPISFDASTFEIWGSLLNGAKLVVMYAHTPTLEEIAGAIEKYEVTILWLTAALFNLMVEQQLEKLKSVRQLFAGGDALSPPHVEKVIKFLPECQLINGYGPTENTTFTCCHLIKQSRINGTSVPIGRPISNTQIYILDSNLQPVPIGVPGELYIGGDGLARGYLNRPELTQEKFIPNPFSDSQSEPERLYKTGDLARYLPDGNIEFLGRIDYQVKIRGFRIELGEIESVLNTHPQIQQVVVIATEELPGNKRLVAYVVTRNESLSTNQLREFLKQKLPEYMVPSAFVILEALPLTPNGKVDRKALPAPDGDFSREHEYVAPRTPREEIIANIFASVLSVPNVGIYDSFFELGGHSLLATQLISRLRVALDLEIPLRELFKFPTIAQLDQSITQLRTSNSGEPSAITLPTIVPAPENKYQSFPLTDIQQAYWLGRHQNFDLGNIATHGYIELDCFHLNLPQLNQAWQKLIEHHDMLRAVVLASGEQQILEKVPAYEIEVMNLRSKSTSAIQEQLEAIREQMSHEVLPAEQWPLFKIRATILDKEHTRLHLSFDALIADAWSMMMLGQQWQQLYENLETVLPPLEISFRDYVLTELLLKDTPQYQQAQEYWFDRNLSPAPELPFALHPSSVTQPKFKRHSTRLNPAQWQQLKQRATTANLTPSAVLLAAFADILNYWSKSPNFTINLTLFNRLPLHPQVNQLVGDFTSLTLLEVDNCIVSPFTARAQRLQQQLWQDLDHSYVSGVEVQRELRRQRGNTQPMGVVFTSTLGLNSLMENTFLNHLGELVYAISQTPQVWLDHQISEQDGALVFNWDVIEELFPPGLIEDMFASYCNWLQQLANTDSAWEETHPQLLPPRQLASIVAVNDTDAPLNQKTLHSLFQKQVAVRSQCPAVITPEQTLTYEELHQLANNLGHQLRQLGATPNTLVAVIMEKGWEQIVAVLGILMSGAAYLPISPEFPEQRQWHLLVQGQVQLVLTQPQLEPNLSLPEGIECLSLKQEELKAAQSNPIESVQTPEDLAYVIYTSGSTGNPKGVMIDHQGAVNTILDINRRFGVGVDDRVLALSALEFDLSVYDIFGLLAAGGAMVIPEPAPCRRKDPAHWLELINTHQVTLWNTVPALMQMLVEHLSGITDKQVGDLRLALLSGDWLPVNLPSQIESLWSNIQVVSLGGATEASIWSILYPIEKVEPNCQSIPYGFPMDNQRFYVLNQWMQPTPTWVSGELYIGGIGLAKGYWQDEEKTKKSFITHPVTQERLYKTGDLGRYLPGGEIEFLGREDFQVKINGYRIELGEVESALKQHPAVKEAIVNSYNNKLVAYVVSELELASDIFEILDTDTRQAQQLWQSLVESGNQQAQQDFSNVEFERFSVFWDAMQRLYLNSVCVAFRQFGVFCQAGEKYTLEKLMSQCQIAPRYHKWLYRALKVLVTQGWLQEQGEIFESLTGLPEVKNDLSLIREELRKNLSWTEKEINWIIQPAENLGNIITEKVHSAQIYAAQETSQIYQKAFSFCHGICQEVMKGIVQSLHPGKELRILEVGAGYGSLTLHLLQLLPPKQTTYVFTDISHFFLQQAQDNFSAYPFVNYSLLDLNVDPVAQGYDLHSFDVIVAASVLHDTRYLERTMGYLRSLLAPGGLMLILEETKFYSSFDLGMGLQQGFDVFEDKSLRSDHPLLSRKQWQTLLADLGFESSAVLNLPGSIPDFLGLDVLLAQGPLSVNKFQPERLSQHLVEKLPRYMLPSSYILLEALPLTPNGKIDRKALPVTDTAKSRLERTFVAPYTPVEEQLAQIWSEVLGVSQVGIYDSFFELGGDSLVATRVISRIRDTFEIEFPLKDFFEEPTINNVSEYIQTVLWVGQDVDNSEVNTQEVEF